MPNRVANLFRVIAACLLLSLANAAGAASVRSGVSQAEALVAKGDWEGALEAYHALQVEHPNEDLVLFGLGCAQYRKAEAMPEGADPAARAALYSEAQATFERLTTSSNPRVAADAAFNRANCVAQKAALLPEQEFKPKVAALQQAVGAYESVLASHPDHTAAQGNLDHVRYTLRMLQQSKPEEQENKDDKGDENKDEQKKQPPQQIIFFTDAQTEIPGAQAVVSPDSDTVELVRPSAAPGATP